MRRQTRTLPWLLCAALIAACGEEYNPATDMSSQPEPDQGVVARDMGRDQRPDVPDLGQDQAASPEDMDAPDQGVAGMWLRDRYPQDRGISADPAVLFHDDFEAGWGRWDAPRQDTAHLFIEGGGQSHAGEHHLRSTVTHAQLLETMYISASPRAKLPRRVDTLHWRLYVRLPNISPNPHHWIRTAAGTPDFSSSGLANTLPDGDKGFWFDFDMTLDDMFQFYVYWYKMRSGRCNDGSVTPGCAGDQGTTYYYGNEFRSKSEKNHIDRDTWTCIEIAARANTVGQQDGSLSAWIDDVPVAKFAPGTPLGTWLRATFHPDGCSFSACTPPAPFEGLELRASEDVRFKEIFLDAYYQRDTWEQRRDAMRERGLEVAEDSTILYDDIVVATERIGCRR
jgi:hypothetical protein